MLTVLKSAFSVTQLSFWTGVFLSSLIGGLLYAATSRSIEREAEERFVNHARHAQSVIGVRVRSYTNLLRSVSSLIGSSENFTHRQFHEYVRELDLSRNFPAVEFINFAVHVPMEQRQAFLGRMRTGTRQFLGDDSNQLDITPPGIRPAYLAVAYIEPYSKRPDLYGYDLLSNRFFGTLLQLERDEGALHAAGSPIPALSTPNNNFLGMRMPVYRADIPRDTIDQRRAAYLGSAGLAFNLPKLLHGVMDEIPVSGIRMTVHDMGWHMNLRGEVGTGHSFTLFDSHGNAADPTPLPDSGPDFFSTTLPLDFNGRPWKIVYSVPKTRLYTESDTFYPKLMMAFGFLASVLLYAMLHMLTSSRRAALELAHEMTCELRDSQRKLQASHQTLRRLADHAYQIKELERKRIAREIHDDLGQNLLALRIEAEMLSSRTRSSHRNLHQRARATLLQIDTTIKSVRQIINDLRPTVLDLGLSAAVEWQVNEFQRRTGIACEIQDDHQDIALPDHCATAFFRILQESLTNIVRHANATRVIVELRMKDGWLTMSICDNGCGMPPDAPLKSGSFGLVGIEERVLILGGTFNVLSRQNEGTTIVITAPMSGVHGKSAALWNDHEKGAATV